MHTYVTSPRDGASVAARIRELRAEVQRLREVASHPSCDADFGIQLRTLADDIHAHVETLMTMIGEGETTGAGPVLSRAEES